MYDIEKKNRKEVIKKTEKLNLEIENERKLKETVNGK